MPKKPNPRKPKPDDHDADDEAPQARSKRSPKGTIKRKPKKGD